TSLVSSVLILITMGFLRSCIYMLRNHFGTLTQHSFNCNQRKLLLSYGLRNSQYLSSKETITMFTEVINQSGIVMNYLSMLIVPAVTGVFFFFAGLKVAPYETLIGVFILAVFLYPLKYNSAKINKYGVGLVNEWENISQTLLRGLKNSFFLKIYQKIEPEIENGNKSL